MRNFVLFAFALVSCTKPIAVRLDDGSIVEIHDDVYREFLTEGDSILIRTSTINYSHSIEASGKFVVPDTYFGTYLSSSGDTIRYIRYYERGIVLRK